MLKNHFHFLIRIRSEEEIKTAFPLKTTEPDKIISLQFSHLFNSYAQSVNKSFDRTGGLFETPFRRIVVADDAYLTQLIYYIHFNPQKHGFVDDFKTYPYSSYAAYVSHKETRLERETGLEWFGDKDAFVNQHEKWAEDLSLDKLLIEF